MNILFLDFDGVVDSFIWNNDETSFELGDSLSENPKVNNFQAVQWVSHFCKKHDYIIVITSSWRIGKGLEFCKQALINGGLQEDVIILDITPIINGATRGKEIKEWLKNQPDVEKFIIIDDDSDVDDLKDHLIQTNGFDGFTMSKFLEAEALDNELGKQYRSQI